MRDEQDAVVVGGGPNGLAAAITLARAGHKVVVLEASGDPAGGMTSVTSETTGSVYDRCSAFHPLATASPFFRSAHLEARGLRWAHAQLPLVHVLDGGEAVALHRSVHETAIGLGGDGEAWRRLFQPLVDRAEPLVDDVLQPMRLPRHPLLLARFGMSAIRSASALVLSAFEDERARALFGGVAAHSLLSLDTPVTAGVGLLLTTLGHAYGWPLAVGGSGRIAAALVEELEGLGGRIETNAAVTDIRELPPSQTVLLNLTPRQVLAIAGDTLPGRYSSALWRYRYGPGVCKMDWTLTAPVPWASDEARRAAVVHVGGSFDEVAAAEAAVCARRHPERPFLILGQPTVADPSRAREGRHTLWGYCHVPHGSTVDMTRPIEEQIERFAPGFRDTVVERSVLTTADLESKNANYIGGDINGGMQDLRQHFTRPVARLDPYSTPVPGLFLCSSSTPPGGGVHGMCGYNAARSAIRKLPRSGGRMSGRGGTRLGAPLG